MYYPHLTIFVLIRFEGLVLVVALAQSWSMKKWGAKWMLSMVIGAYSKSYPVSPLFLTHSMYPAFALGLGFRFGLHSQPESKGLYIAEYLFVVLSVSLGASVLIFSVEL